MAAEQELILVMTRHRVVLEFARAAMSDLVQGAMLAPRGPPPQARSLPPITIQMRLTPQLTLIDN